MHQLSKQLPNRIMHALFLWLFLSFSQLSIAEESTNTAALQINFPGLSSVHTEIRLSDHIADSATGPLIKRANWKTNSTQVQIATGIYDLVIKKGAGKLIIDDVDCSQTTCTADNIVALLNIKFKGLSSVHSSVHVADGILGTASGNQINKKNWQRTQAIIPILRQIVDVKVRKGGGAIVVDNVDCRSEFCMVSDITATLTVSFPGMNSIHTAAYVSDGIDNTVSGKKITHKNWQKNQAVFTVLRQTIDLKIRKKNETLTIDAVDCTSGQCFVDDLTATLTIHFPGLNSMHSAVYATDEKEASVSGERVFHKNWQKDQAILSVFRKLYDVRIQRQNSLPLIVDNIDCSSGSCTVDDLTATLTVKFNGLKSVHTSVRQPDNQPGTAEGIEFRHKNWQKDQAQFTVLRQQYDVRIKRNHSEAIIIDQLDCTSGQCMIDQITATLTVKFPQMNSVHTAVYIPDDLENTTTEKKAFSLNWQKDQAEIIVFRQAYDIKIQRGHSEPMIIDNLDCRSGNCLIDQLTAQLKVDFADLSSVHTSVFIPDNADGTANGQEVTRQNWKKNQANLIVFKQIYDVRVKKGKVSKILDNIDCTSGECHITDLTSRLTIRFPGLRHVHSSAHVPDNIDNSASGHRSAKSNWKTHQTTIPLLRATYDVKVKHNVESVFDNVDCQGPECQVVIQGNVQALLIDGDLNRPLSNIALFAYEKLANGSLHKIARGQTSEQGQVNFTLPNVSANKLYVLKAYNPFGRYKSFYSAFISNEGSLSFIITADGENTLDLTPPAVAITTPENGGNVTNLGFQVSGTASDNRNIDRIAVTINDAMTGSHTLSSIYNSNTSTWTASVPAGMVSLNNDVVITATAFDKAQSQSSATITVSIIEDNTGPQITITSHMENNDVPATGFLLSGTVTDLTAVASLNASLVDLTLGQTISNQALNFSINNGTWTLAVNNGLMTENGTVTISLNATDTVGNAESKSIQLQVVAVDYSNAHMINRITFGATPALIKEVQSIGAVSFLEQQLNPDSIDDNEFSTLIPDLPSTKEALQVWTVKHMVYGRRQLQEVMTWFWDNHFNTNINAKRTNAEGDEISNSVAFELAENQSYRANALGNFRDLLEISAKSPSMLIYLDNISNIAGDSNENYARELYELATMGVDEGYTDQDVEFAAEIFTGWHLQNNAFFFDSTQHSVGSYTLFNGTAQQVFIAEGGVSQGDSLLDALAEHPSTAKFICTKLVTVFVDDTPPATLVTRCAEAFLNFSNDDNQMQQILRLIMQSAEFNDAAYFRSKIKTPVEYVVGAVRNLEARSEVSDLISPIAAIGIRLYENPVPTGWSEKGSDWINANLLIQRMKWINRLVRNNQASNGSTTDPLQFYPANGVETADGIVGFLLQLTVGDDITALGRNNALNILGSDFDLTNPEADAQLRQLNGTVMSYPQYQFQ